MPALSRRASALVIALAPLVALPAATAGNAPGCGTLTPRACLDTAIDAMGGRARLQSVSHIEWQGMGHTLLMEQSYRQEPFLASYQRYHEWLDFAGARVRSEQTLTWPQAGGTSPTDITSTLVMTPQGGDYRSGERSQPLPGNARVVLDERLQMEPMRLLLTADHATHLRYGKPQMLHGVLHTSLAFDVDGRTWQVLLDPVTHLPDALQRTRTFDDFWYAWGDVSEQIDYDNWILVDGFHYPSTRIEERNGKVWRSTQVLTVTIDGATPASTFDTTHARPADGTFASRWELPFDGKHPVALAPGVDLYPGAWNTALIKQDDGVVVLESPISPVYTAGLLDLARQRYPDLPIKAVLTTSDSWPHAAGVREAVARHLPVYALDLNLPLLQRLVDAPHRIHPDHLQRQPAAPDWRIVSGRTVIGSGAQRIELYPLRGADTGRQYMVYFPASRLLYASDTLVLDPKSGALYQPELMAEVAQAVDRAHLDVRTVFAMHQGPTPWKQVLALLKAANKGATKGGTD
ncbi:hypothetical protein ATSB10_04050 [Dyella thiooxydans]|uniref:Metallo-beta-lactamase domain-containing protein n=1 Tax=Dyella thiooxydans TaxID=445710 RepID=A0A161J706_9GAMM|nr:hypothetical protein [Dyella thiooxydans]AND67859.1 hypothetical protein ATSB10_04050 [Dyella thiooxydans]